MARRLKRKLLIGATLVAVLACASAAVVMAAQPSGTRRGTQAHHRARGTLATAAGYLGLSTAQLRGELEAGKSLAQIAGASSGKSEAGLIEALEAADRQKLATAAAELPRRVAREVDRPGGPRGVRARRARTLSVAARYLGVSTGRLRQDLRSGTTLADLAKSSSGKSQAGLVEALVTARKQELATAVKAGRITQARANEIAARLGSRVSVLVNRARAGALAAPARPSR
ncbi:MAG TPA: hypothetical protein VMF09_03335 [Solirubrobacteraceae bacterium]|nr:hypothetical protein [Solirubrobacteraceae bacterium]